MNEEWNIGTREAEPGNRRWRMGIFLVCAGLVLLAVMVSGILLDGAAAETDFSRKNLAFTNKIRIMSQKTTREKLLAYLLSQAKAQGASQFTIPLDRQSLADYLGVERSAMSAEISKLKKAGLLDTKGSWFSLNQSTP